MYSGWLNANLLRGNAVLFKLLGNQVLSRDLEFLLMGIASQCDHVHTVRQRFRYCAIIVCRCDKHDIAQIKRHIDIMIVKGGVLLGIQNLQKRGGRVTAEIVAELVNLVQQKQRVLCPRLLDGRNDTSRHGAHIRLTVAHDVGFIPHAAEGDAHIFAPNSLCNRTRNGGLANARRPNQADDLPLDVRR